MEQNRESDCPSFLQKYIIFRPKVTPLTFCFSPSHHCPLLSIAGQGMIRAMLRIACLCIGAFSVATSLELQVQSTIFSSNISRQLSNDEELTCLKYSNRSFVPPEQQKHPAVLWTFPGSGSGWVRLLIEHATGIIGCRPVR